MASNGPRIQKPRKTVKVPSDATATVVTPRVQGARATVVIPKSQSGSFGSAGPEMDSMNLPTNKPIDHGPRKDEGHYSSPPRKRGKKITGKIKK